MLSIIYQDNHLFCADKPGGLLTQPSGTERDSLEAQAKAWIKVQYSKPGAVFLEAAHRIDAPACGVVLFARTSKALSRLAGAIRNGECTKEYRILTDHVPPKKAATLANFMLHDDHIARIVRPGTPGAFEAVLSYEVMECRTNGTALLKVLLKSGRYHQIRAQFAHLGCPVVGDAKYGSIMPYRNGCIALQHYCLSIAHPVTKAALVLQSAFVL